MPTSGQAWGLSERRNFAWWSRTVWALTDSPEQRSTQVFFATAVQKGPNAATPICSLCGPKGPALGVSRGSTKRRSAPGIFLKIHIAAQRLVHYIYWNSVLTNYLQLDLSWSWLGIWLLLEWDVDPCIGGHTYDHPSGLIGEYPPQSLAVVINTIHHKT